MPTRLRCTWTTSRSGLSVSGAIEGTLAVHFASFVQTPTDRTLQRLEDSITGASLEPSSPRRFHPWFKSQVSLAVTGQSSGDPRVVGMDTPCRQPSRYAA